MSDRNTNDFEAAPAAGRRGGDSKESHQRFESALEYAAIGMALISPEGRWLKVNSALCEILGYKVEEFISKTFQDLTHPEDQDVDIEHLERMLIGEIHSYQVEKRFLHKKGYVVWVLQSISLVRDGGGAAFRFILLIQDITERKLLERRLTHLAYHDPLTGLSNRSLFREHLEGALVKAERKGEHLALLYLDLDGFKSVNDTFGHETGDRLLVAVARRLEATLRLGEETIARFGGDEFCVLLEDIADTDAAVSVARRMKSALRKHFAINDHLISSVNVSIGIAVKAPKERKTARQLLREADTAMYRAKKSGKDHYEVFEPSMTPRALEDRKRLEDELRRAVEGAGFRLHYQPKVSLRTGTICGWEALVRWEHPVGRLVVPAEFVPLAEETEMVIPLGRWVLTEACRQAKEWKERYPGSTPTMHVNFSARQFHYPALIEEVADILEETELEPSSLCMEITESTAMDDAPFTIIVFRKLKELGVSLAIDDFGAGYSSLSYLKRFPVDAIKIDRSIVEGVERDPGNAAIVSAAITLAHALGLEAIAEGVETEVEATELHTLGCDFGQGYYWSKPRPAHAAAELLETNLDS